MTAAFAEHCDRGHYIRQRQVAQIVVRLISRAGCGRSWLAWSINVSGVVEAAGGESATIGVPGPDRAASPSIRPTPRFAHSSHSPIDQSTSRSF